MPADVENVNLKTLVHTTEDVTEGNPRGTEDAEQIEENKKTCLTHRVEHNEKVMSGFSSVSSVYSVVSYF